jgi:hypothetical protein
MVDSCDGNFLDAIANHGRPMKYEWLVMAAALKRGIVNVTPSLVAWSPAPSRVKARPYSPKAVGHSLHHRVKFPKKTGRQG